MRTILQEVDDTLIASVFHEYLLARAGSHLRPSDVRRAMDEFYQEFNARNVVAKASPRDDIRFFVVEWVETKVRFLTVWAEPYGPVSVHVDTATTEKFLQVQEMVKDACDAVRAK